MKPPQMPEPELLYKPGEVAARFRVDLVTVRRWAQTGKLNPVVTPGGHRRYKASEIDALLRGES